MNFKLILLICFITAFVFNCGYSFNVTLAWNPSISANVTGYKIYDGIQSGNYTNIIDVGNVTNAVVSNLVSDVTYYFAATAYAPISYDTNFIGNTNLIVESPFSNETSYTVPLPINITYVGVQVDYGVNLTSINSQKVLVMSVTNSPGYFYNESLIITNRPFVGTIPSDTNRYVYIGTIIRYGPSIVALNSSIFPLITFTNPPSYYYRSALILTNNPF